MDLMDSERNSEALNSLKFWLTSIETYGVIGNVSGDTQNLSLCFSPVALVGTHFGSIKNKDDNITAQKLKEINELIVDVVHTSKVLQIEDNNPLFQRCQFLYDSKHNLCFWLVDNSDLKDKNITSLQSILVEALRCDPRDYIYDHVPIFWFECIDKLNDISKEEPLIIF